MLAWLSRVVVLVAGGWSARAYARDFVRAYIRGWCGTAWSPVCS